MKTKKRNLVKQLKVGDKVIKATTMKGYADILGKSKDAVIRYEALDYFPPAFLTIGTYKYYPLTLCERVRDVVKNFPTNRPPSADLIVKINQIYNEERNKLCQK